MIFITGTLRETQTDLLHKHLSKNPNHANADWYQRSITGEVWHSDYKRRDTKLQLALYRKGSEASEEQRKAYELLFGREGFRSQDICLVGVAASGKTWISKKLSSLLQCIFFGPGETIRCAPIGRVACSFHPEARTIHCVMELRPNSRNSYPESFDELTDHMNQLSEDHFAALKVFVASEAFMCTTPHLEVLLTCIKKKAPNCVLLFDGDSMQVTMKATVGYPSQPFLTRNQFETLCPGTQVIVFEKSLKHRIKNPIKLAHLDKMRLGQATAETVKFFEQERISQQKHPVTRLFANTKPAIQFNNDKLQEILNLNQHLQLVQLRANDTSKEFGTLVTMSSTEESSLPVDGNIRVVKGAPILIVQNHVAEILHDCAKKIYVGNGTTGIFWEHDKTSDTIIAKISVGPKNDQIFVRIKRRVFSTATKKRSQFPIMLAWAATIHKVQGMEFQVIEVDYGMDSTGSNGLSEFYQGLAYMAFSRAEKVVATGRLTVGLLNNINLHSRNWWLSQIQKWNAFKDAKVTPSKVFRNAVHQHNWHAAALQKKVSACASAQVPASSSVPVSATAHNQTPSIAGFASASVAPAAKQTAPAPAPAPAPNPVPASAPARVSASALTTVVNSKRRITPPTDFGESDGDLELIVLPPVTPPEKRPAAPAPAPVFALASASASASGLVPATVPNPASAPSIAVGAQRSKRRRILPTEKQVSDIIDKSYSEVITHPEILNRYKNMSSQTYGESNMPLVSKLVAEIKQMEGQIFVDLGSGVGQVCMMVAALSRASKCFGIELMPNPAHYAANLLANFQSRAQQSGVTLCPIELIHGDFLQSEAVKTALSSAGLVYINNPSFAPELNLQVLSE